MGDCEIKCFGEFWNIYIVCVKDGSLMLMMIIIMVSNDNNHDVERPDA